MRVMMMSKLRMYNAGQLFFNLGDIRWVRLCHTECLGRYREWYLEIKLRGQETISTWATDFDTKEAAEEEYNKIMEAHLDTLGE